MEGGRSLKFNFLYKNNYFLLQVYYRKSENMYSNATIQKIRKDRKMTRTTCRP